MDKIIPINVSNLETIDMALKNWIQEHVNASCKTRDGFKNVPIIWVSAERSYQSKRNKEHRDSAGTVNLPLIIIERTQTLKDLTRKGGIVANVPNVNDEKGGAAPLVITRRIKQDKTSNFASADIKRRKGQINFPSKNKKIVYETISIPMPSYVSCFYNVTIKTQYQQQMNEILQPFITTTGGINYFVCTWEEHRYEGFIDKDFKFNNNISKLAEEERKYETVITIEVLGHLIGDGVNQIRPTAIIRENAVQYKIPKEHIIVGDKNIVKGKDEGYFGIGGLGGTNMSGSF